MSHSNNAAANPDCPHKQHIFDAELKAARQLDDAGRGAGEESAEARSIWGLAFSGGGIRSASFALGVLQRLAELPGFGRVAAAREPTPTAQQTQKLLSDFDYLSTVSGGGYTGAVLHSLLHRPPPPQTPTTEKPKSKALESEAPKSDTSTAASKRQQAYQALAARDRDSKNSALPWLRLHSNFLNPSKGALSGDSLALVGRVAGPVLVVACLFGVLGIFLMLGLFLGLNFLRWLAESQVIAVEVKALITGVPLGLVALLAVWRPDRTITPIRDGQRSFLTIVLLALGCVGLSVAALDPQIAHIDQNAWLAASLVLVGLMALFKRSNFSDRLRRTVVAMLVMAAALMAWLGIATALQASRTAGYWMLPTLLAPTVMALLIYFGAVVYQSLAGSIVSNNVREFWARQPARLLIVLGGLFPLLLSSMVVALPLVNMTDALYGSLGGGAWLLATAWALFRGRLKARRNDERRPSTPISLQIVLPLVALGVLWMLGIASSSLLLWQAGIDCTGGDCVSTIAGAIKLWQLCSGALVTTAAILLLGLAVLAFFLLYLLDPNLISHSEFYATRLSRAFLGFSRLVDGENPRKPDPVTGFDPNDDFFVRELIESTTGTEPRQAVTLRKRPLRPFPLICTAVNLSGRQQLDWQDRLAASFVLSPIWSGYMPAGACVADSSDTRNRVAGDPLPTKPVDLSALDPYRLATMVKLGRAIAISGAAAHPMMGSQAGALQRMLMTLFNVRLGWWLPNRAKRGASNAGKTLLPGVNLLREFVGSADLDGDQLMLSDGGHFDNTGLYELIRRKCRFVIVTDAGADPDYLFEDLGKAVRLCRIDFGVEIDIDTGSLQPDASRRARAPCATASIRYPDGTRGMLLLLKPVLLGNEPSDVAHYASKYPVFPQQSTADQFFDEAQFESYRQLGYRNATSALEALVVGLDGNEEEMATTEEQALLRLRRAWTPNAPVGADAFSRHADTIAELMRELGSDAELAPLLAEFNPELDSTLKQSRDQPPAIKAGSAADAEPDRQLAPSTIALDEASSRRAFAWCQSLIQLMEQVYGDLDLHRFHNHPDNQGWMNLFHHWSWSPTFRMAWALSQSIFGARFVDFCERQLDLKLVLKMSELSPLDLPAAALIADETGEKLDGLWQHRFALFNTVERNIISEQVKFHASQRPNARYHYSLVPLDYTICTNAERRPTLRVGYALAVETAALAHELGKDRRLLIAIRIRDHVRASGHGRRFLLQLADAEYQIDQAHLSRQYGDDESVSEQQAKDFESDFNRLRKSLGKAEKQV